MRLETGVSANPGLERARLRVVKPDTEQRAVIKHLVRDSFPGIPPRNDAENPNSLQHHVLFLAATGTELRGLYPVNTPERRATVEWLTMEAAAYDPRLADWTQERDDFARSRLQRDIASDYPDIRAALDKTDLKLDVKDRAQQIVFDSFPYFQDALTDAGFDGEIHGKLEALYLENRIDRVASDLEPIKRQHDLPYHLLSYGEPIFVREQYARLTAQLDGLLNRRGEVPHQALSLPEAQDIIDNKIGRVVIDFSKRAAR
jgi:hypothetical protein